jgi:hypothetical protein
VIASNGEKLVEANEAATQLLLEGVGVEGDAHIIGGRGRTVRFIDFDHPERNEFLQYVPYRSRPLLVFRPRFDFEAAEEALGALFATTAMGQGDAWPSRTWG